MKVACDSVPTDQTAEVLSGGPTEIHTYSDEEDERDGETILFVVYESYGLVLLLW